MRRANSTMTQMDGADAAVTIARQSDAVTPVIQRRAKRTPIRTNRVREGDYRMKEFPNDFIGAVQKAVLQPIADLDAAIPNATSDGDSSSPVQVGITNVLIDALTLIDSLNELRVALDNHPLP
jgi:hypothetical protein